MLRGSTGAFLSLMLLFTLSPGSCEAREPAVDPGTGRIRVIYLGDAWGGGSPYQHMVLDPKLSVTPVPASAGHGGGMPNISRYIRIYVPRTYNRLVESQDVIILSDTVKTYYQLVKIFHKEAYFAAIKIRIENLSYRLIVDTVYEALALYIHAKGVHLV